MNDNMISQTESPMEILKERNEVSRVSRVRFFVRCITAMVFGGLLILAFPCCNFSYLAWIGIIPLYILVYNMRWNRAFIVGMFWGYGWSLASTFWLRSIEPFIPYAFAVILAVFYAVWATAVPLAKRYIYVPAKVQLQGFNASSDYLNTNFFPYKELLLVIFLACWWCIIEWVRTWIFTGFPWNLLAISQWQKLGIIQIASVTGIYGVSFIIIFMNLALANAGINIYKILKFNNKSNRWRIVPLSLYIALIIILGTFYFGVNRIKDNSNKELVELKAAAAQGDIPQIRFYSEKEANNALNTYYDLSLKILPSKPDVMIWPESAVPQPLRGGDLLSLEYRNDIAYLIKEFKTQILLGTIDYDYLNPESVKYFNSAYLIDREGEFAKRYNKMHLVPWGEYTPFEHLWPLSYIYPWIKKKFGMGRSLTPGTENTIFNLKKDVNASVLICYEDVFPNIARRHVLNGANLLITITNDAWFPKKDELEQHIAQAVFRAVENGRPMIRNGNCAGTCVIQPNGLITDSIFYKKDSKGKLIPAPEIKGKGAAAFKVNITKTPELTFYTIYGNVFIYFCIIIFVVIFMLCAWNWSIKKSYLLRKRGGEL